MTCRSIERCSIRFETGAMTVSHEGTRRNKMIRKVKNIKLMFLAAFLLALAGCENPADPKPKPEPDAPTISAVVLDRTSAEALTGGTVEFAVSVSGTDGYSAEVDWSVSGNTDTATTISPVSTDDTSLALLSVAQNERAAELTVTVSSRADNTKKALAVVTVVQSVPAGAKAWYISSEDGDDDENDGLSKDSPLFTFGAALEAIKTAYAAGWPGKGTGNEERAYIVIDGEIAEDMGGTGTTVKNRSSFIISSAAAGAGDYPPIELRGLNSSSRGTLKAWTSKRVLYVDFNTVYLGSYLTLTGGDLNASTNAQGGGVYAGNGSQVILDGAEIKNNKTIYNTNSTGGGVYTVGTAAAPTLFTIERGIVEGNEAKGSGGGLAIGAGTTFILKSGEIKNNTAEGSGGGVYFTGANNNRSAFNMEGGEIRGNKAGPSATSNGGGLYTGAYADFKMTGGTIAGNIIDNTGTSATGSYGGAGVYMAGDIEAAQGTFQMGGAARIAEDNEVMLAASQTLSNPTPVITICEAFTASPAGPAAKIDLAGQVSQGTPDGRWKDQVLLAWSDGLSGALPIDRFTLNNFRRGPAAGEDSYTLDINSNYYVDAADGKVKAKVVTVTNIALSVTPDTRAYMDQGAYLQFKVVVTGMGNPPQTVSWSVNSEKSAIDENGLLHVGDDEDQSSLTVTVVSALEGFTASPSASKTVHIAVPVEGQRAWYVSAGGNDDNHGRSAGSPLASVKQALTLIKDYNAFSANRNNWPKNGDKEIHARIVISGEISITEPMAAGSGSGGTSENAGSAIVVSNTVTRADPTRRQIPPIHFEGNASTPGILKAAATLSNVRVMRIQHATVTLGSNLTITGANITSVHTPAGLMGGGVWADNGADLTLNGAAITGNICPRGGGILVGHQTQKTSGTDASVVTRLSFISGSVTGNHAGDTGGGMYLYPNAIVEMTGGTIAGNTRVNKSDTTTTPDGLFILAHSDVDETYHNISIFRIGGTASIDRAMLSATEDGLYVYSGGVGGTYNPRPAPYPIACITLLDTFPGEGAPVTTIDLHVVIGGMVPTTAPTGIWTLGNYPLFKWASGSGPFPVNKFTLGNTVNSLWGNDVVERYAVTPITGYHINAASGVLTADTP